MEKSGSYPAVFLANIRKERTHLHPGTAYTGTWRIFGKCVETTSKEKVDAILASTLQILLGGSTKKDPLFFAKKTCFITRSRCITVGGSVLLCKVHIKYNGSKICIFATLVGKGLMETKRNYYFSLL